MGLIQFPLTEIVAVVKSNSYLPDKIENVTVSGNDIIVTIDTAIPVINTIQLTLKFHGFSAGKCYLIAHHKGITDRLLRGIKFDKLDHVSIKFPYIEINVEKILAEKVSGLEIANVMVRDGDFIIETRAWKIGV